MPYELGGEDQSVAMEWRSRSPNSLLPMLSGAGIRRSSPISQSGAIVCFLATRLGMDGKDVMSATRTDVLFETAKDLGSLPGKEDVVATINPKKNFAKSPFSVAKMD